MKLVSLGCMMVFLVGCGSDADKLTLDGVDELARCDIRAAHDKFADAHANDPDHPQAALGFALTDLALLPEDATVTAILARIGFTGPMDMQALVFGPDGALARHARGDTCESIDTFVNATIPYPPLANTTIDASTLIDGTLKGTDFAAAAVDLSPRLQRIATALETAAVGMAEPVEVEGGCGLGKVTFQAPELYFAAAALEGIRSAIALGQAYNWDISIRQLQQAWNGDAFALVALLNQNIGRVANAGSGTAGHAPLARGLDLFVRGLDAAKVATTQPDQLFDWPAFPDAILDDFRRLAVSIQGSLEGSTTLADVMPTLSLDLRTVFSAPIDLQSFGTPLFEALDEFTWDIDGTVLEQALTPLFSPSPFVDGASYQWTPETTWNMFDATPVTMPFDRYDAVYNCMMAL